MALYPEAADITEILLDSLMYTYKFVLLFLSPLGFLSRTKLIQCLESLTVG